jgi:hypothetical protein
MFNILSCGNLFKKKLRIHGKLQISNLLSDLLQFLFYLYLSSDDLFAEWKNVVLDKHHSWKLWKLIMVYEICDADRNAWGFEAANSSRYHLYSEGIQGSQGSMLLSAAAECFSSTAVR